MLGQLNKGSIDFEKKAARTTIGDQNVFNSVDHMKVLKAKADKTGCKRKTINLAQLDQ